MATTKLHQLDELNQNDIDGCFPVLLDIENEDIIWTEEEKQLYQQEDFHFRLISDDRQVRYRNKVWLPCNFSITPPESTGSNIGSATVTISMLDARVRRLLRLINNECKFTIVASYAKYKKDNTTNAYVYQFFDLRTIDLYLSSASANDVSASLTLEFDDITKQQIPYDTATADRLPSISEDDL